MSAAWADGLPLPAPIVPEEPRLPPTVVTSAGQRLLLGHVDVDVSFDAANETLRTNRPGWWLINYPLKKIAGLKHLSEEEIARQLFGRSAGDLQNWYVRTPGTSDEPEVPNGPAPFEPHSTPDLIVDQRHANASDDNVGSADAPFKTIAAAVVRAEPGNVIHVYPGIYRETVVAETPGTAAKPIVVEGIRDTDGSLPTISGNDVAPENAWQPVDRHPGVWRAENWTKKPAALTLDGQLMTERTVVSELGDYEFSLNLADPELAMPRLSGTVSPRENQTDLDRGWSRQVTDAEGNLSLGDERGVYYLSTWFWKEPGKAKEVWDPSHPEPLTGEMVVKGPFRASRQGGSGNDGQLNLYRLWINGELMPASTRADEPIARTGYGRNGDTWMRLPFQEGWNHLVVLLDSRHRKGASHTIRFDLPKGFADTVTRAVEVDDKSQPGPGEKKPFLSEWMVLGPVAVKSAEVEQAIYVKFPEGRDPNRELIDMGRRERALSLEAPWWTVRGMEFVHGSQYQQRTLVSIGAYGVTVEHCRFRETEVRTLTLNLSKWDQTDPPSVVRGNHFLSPGSLGIGCSGNTKLLTGENQSSTAPGRGRMLVEHNRISNNNRSGFKRLWESGAMKFFRCTGCVIRYNTIQGGDGPGIWLDWEHYSNRLEGNDIRDVPSFAIGFEASPGPQLVANNVTQDIRNGSAWFKYSILAWSSARVWAVSNTVTSNNGALFSEGGSNRGTVWQTLPERNAAVINNLFRSPSHAIHRGNIGWVAGNRFYADDDRAFQRYSRWSAAIDGKAIEQSEQVRRWGDAPEFENPHVGNFCYGRSHEASTAGIASHPIVTDGQTVDPVGLVKHDFYGLLRFPEDGVPAGAFRIECEPLDGTSTQVELEWIDGSIERRWQAKYR